MKKKKYILIDEMDDKDLFLNIAFYGIDNEDQILCFMSEDSVVDLMKRYNYGVMPNNFNIDIDVQEYINEKYDKPTLQLD